jgi:glycerophosphoryl diester phosphodiesterase
VSSPARTFPVLDPGWGSTDAGRPVLAFAHRGGARHPDLVGLENTLLAFRHAYDLGYRYLETDVHATQDGHLVAFHDPDLGRVTEHHGVIEGLSLAEVLETRVGGRELVPRFEELVEELPEARFNVDVKSPAAVEPLADLVRRMGLEGRVVVSSFSHGRTQEFRRASRGRVATGATPQEIARFVLLPSAVADWRLDPTVAALHVPVRRHSLPVTTPRLVRRAHAAGVQVHVWTVDEPQEIERLLGWEVDGLMTDRTDVLKRVLVQHGRWRETP